MVKYRYRSAVADLRAACLGGETHAQAVAALKGVLHGTPSIPAAEGDQARLEAYFWSAVCWPDDYFAHPLGIRRVRPRPDGLVIELDGGHVLTKPLVYSLLPRISQEYGLAGYPGVRAAWDDEADGVVVRLVGTNATIVIQGVTETDWQQAEKELLTQAPVDEALWEPGTELHQLEHEELAPRELNFHLRNFQLESALLRRVAVFHTISSPNNVTAWTSGPWHACDAHADCGGFSWAIEAFFAPTLGLATDELIEAITKTSDMTLREVIDVSDGDRQGRGRAVYVYFASTNPCVGRLQLRLRTWSHQTIEELRRELSTRDALCADDVERLAPLRHIRREV